ncbi:hypothetical protein SGFS_043240 [Streptomyces graminofaciens]|uniref:Lipoprotein n=1 Tax=Streptomyces graminofaciens TaxID=68212 RepID=A0ABM7FAF4_9ACTN|nr:hypothetical protein [Streptomyces graminofaciens]BBC33030.1 hypothetical protein SGFS_043240 [Streptomyces graminofaciens]
MSRIRFRSATPVVILAVVLAGCSGEGTEGDGPVPDLGAIPRVRSSADISDLPMDGYILGKEQYGTYLKAQRSLIRRCMSRFGFDFRAMDAVLDAGEVPDLRPDMTRYYFLIDADAAATSGYRAPERHRPVEEGDGTGEDTTPTAAERAVLVGSNAGKQVDGEQVPEGGCRGEANRETLGEGGTDSFLQLPNDRVALRARTDADERVKKVFGEWSACMEKAGYDYDDPMQANDDDKWDASKPAGQAEIQVAKADVACKQKVNVVGVWWAVQAAYEKQYIEKNAERMAEVKRTVDAVLRNSGRLVGGGA